MTVKERIAALRDKMRANGIDAYIVFDSDEHMSEYLPEYYRERSWISGFTGSAGTVVVTQQEAGLWTDGRYYLQAASQLSGSGVTLFRASDAGVISLTDYLFKSVASGGTIALMIDWRVALVVWGGFLVLAIATKYVSLGSCWAGLSFPFVSWFVYQNYVILILSIICGGLILWRHRGNINRLIHGTESKFHFHKKAK